jgi:dienelactone hydrolase
MTTATVRRQGKRLFVWLVAVAIVVSAAGVVYVGTPLRGTPASIADVEENPSVTVNEASGAYVLEPASAESTAGLVFYPGGRVHPDAYLASLAPLATQANVTVVVPAMPLNLAVFDQGAASQYVTGSAIDTWYVGGHSLGGVMACRYARANPNRVDGLLLFAAYCDKDVSETNIPVLSVAGSADTVLDRDAYESNLANLPASATVREVPLNHSQFGSYRGQSGDSPSGVTYREAHDRLADVVLSWLRNQR